MIKSHYYTTVAPVATPVPAINSVDAISSFMQIIILTVTLNTSILVRTPSSFSLKIGSATYTTTNYTLTDVPNQVVVSFYGIPAGVYTISSMKCQVSYTNTGRTVSSAFKTISNITGKLTHKIIFQIIDIDISRDGFTGWTTVYTDSSNIKYFHVYVTCYLPNIDLNQLADDGYLPNFSLIINLNRTINFNGTSITNTNNPYKGPYSGYINSVPLLTSQPLNVEFEIPADSIIDNYSLTNDFPSLLSYIKSTEISVTMTVSLPNADGSYTSTKLTSTLCSI
jgi:hypothetical protein